MVVLPVGRRSGAGAVAGAGAGIPGSAGCGLALLCPQETQAAAFRLMARGRIPVEAVYLGDKTSWRRESA